MTNTELMRLEMGSHLHILLPCLQKTRGPVLELGCGFFSTALLSLYSQTRYCRSVETNPAWYWKVKNFFYGWIPAQGTEENRHDFLWVDRYAEAILDDRFWDVVLIDQQESERGDSAKRLRGHCRLMLVHDTEREYLDEILDNFRYRFDFREIHPHTSVGSDLDDLKWLEGYMDQYLKYLMPPLPNINQENH